MKKCVLLLAMFSVLLGSAADAGTFRPKIKVPKVKNFDFTTGIDNPAWETVPAGQFLKLIGNVNDINRKPEEGASVKYLYDDQYFYVRAEFIDSDIVVNATSDGGHFYKNGDVLEIFIKPGKSNYYWEIYGTPNNLNTRFVYGSRSNLGLPSGFKHDDVKIKVTSRINGTLNKRDDRDQSCIILVAIPLSELNLPHLKTGHPAGTVPFAPGEDWRVQSARYNYSRYLDKYELSSYPQTFGGYHSLEYFAQIELLK